jgi:predicted MPP superfamily phosphohydrolase
MSYLFAAIFFGAPVLTAIWWCWADYLLRSAQPSTSDISGAATRRFCWRPARMILALFGLVFFVGFGWLLVGRLWPESLLILGLPRVPEPWLMGFLMLWAMVVLPLAAVPSLAVWCFWRMLSASMALRKRARSRWRRRGDVQDPTDESLTRRQLLTGALATAPVWTTVGLTGLGLVQKRHFRIRELTIAVPALPRSLDGMTIAHVSDTHVGKFTRGEVLDRIADATNDLAADLVLMTGDLIDHSLHDLPEAVRMVDRIDRRSGLFLIEGNHDLFDGREAFRQGVHNAGLPLLLNETAIVSLRGSAVQLLGLTWHGRGGSIEEQVEAVARQRDAQAFPILLAHHPHAFDRASTLGFPLTLAGHTHGGQLMLTPDLGAGPALFKYWSGLYEQEDSRLVVSNGAGNWFPLRTNAPAEILHITLRAIVM